ncbi:MAG: hypothetical protein LM523_11800 [Candidatus Contendobacter sp.]|nr:hypothetical protein [Candidatus Contendobacter sp.]
MFTTFSIPFLPDVDVKRGYRNALMAEQGLDVHPFRPGVEQIRGVSMAQWADLSAKSRIPRQTLLNQRLF